LRDTVTPGDPYVLHVLETCKWLSIFTRRNAQN